MAEHGPNIEINNSTNQYSEAMAHPQQQRFCSFVRETLPQYFRARTVLEVGSLNINGSVRVFFEDCVYTGIDVAPGRDVDVVATGEDYGGEANSVDVIISCETFEHNPEYIKTFLNMVRLLKRDGLLMLTCATYGRPQHGTSKTTPSDSPLTVGKGQEYYRNLTEADFGFIDLSYFFADFFFVVDHSSHDLYFLGIGKAAGDLEVTKFAKAKLIATAFYKELAQQGLR
jgi:hypothetical protein